EIACKPDEKIFVSNLSFVNVASLSGSIKINIIFQFAVHSALRSNYSFGCLALQILRINQLLLSVVQATLFLFSP
ncbi:MAG: hypothetical protein ABJA76_08535, partial [Mucilaginibacter sp.]